MTRLSVFTKCSVEPYIWANLAIIPLSVCIAMNILLSAFFALGVDFSWIHNTPANISAIAGENWYIMAPIGVVIILLCFVPALYLLCWRQTKHYLLALIAGHICMMCSLITIFAGMVQIVGSLIVIIFAVDAPAWSLMSFSLGILITVAILCIIVIAIVVAGVCIGIAVHTLRGIRQW